MQGCRTCRGLDASMRDPRLGFSDCSWQRSSHLGFLWVYMSRGSLLIGAPSERQAHGVFSRPSSSERCEGQQCTVGSFQSRSVACKNVTCRYFAFLGFGRAGCCTRIGPDAQNGNSSQWVTFLWLPFKTTKESHTLKTGPGWSQLGGCFKLQLWVFDVNTGRHAKTY